MESALILLFVVVVCKEISTQDIFSERCRKPQSIAENPIDCCELPEPFSLEPMADCDTDLDHRVNGFSFLGSPECAQTTCVLRSQDLLFENDDIDKESVKQHFDEWVENRKEYMPAVNAIKDRCASWKPMFGVTNSNPRLCPGDIFLFCVEITLYDKCPHWVDSEGCTALRSYLEDCMPYFSNYNLDKADSMTKPKINSSMSKDMIEILRRAK